VEDAEVDANPRAARGPRRLVAVASALMCVVSSTCPCVDNFLSVVASE
jgi:hypothetical protein